MRRSSDAEVRRFSYGAALKTLQLTLHCYASVACLLCFENCSLSWLFAGELPHDFAKAAHYYLKNQLIIFFLKDSTLRNKISDILYPDRVGPNHAASFPRNAFGEISCSCIKSNMSWHLCQSTSKMSKKSHLTIKVS